MAKRIFAPLHNPKNNSYLISFELFSTKIILGLILLLSLPFSTPASLAVAASDEVKWSRFNIPTEGSAGNWVLADGSDVQHLTMAIDGTLYGYATPSGTSYTLFKSTDDGESWSYTGKVKDTIVDIAAAPDEADVVYYATPSNVYRSTDGGSSFVPLPPSPGGAGSNNIEITSIDVAPPYSQNIIAVGTRDSDSSQFGSIYILDEETALPRWLDTNPGNYDIYAIAFSPSYPTDWRLVAVATDENDTIITTKVGDAAWGATIGNARLERDNSGISVAVATSADIAFPSEYDANEDVLFAAIDTGSDNGDVYMITGADAPDPSTATDLNIGAAYGLSNIDVTSLAVTGSAAINILAGAAASAQVYYSDDGGKNWTRSNKGPTGQSKTHVLVAPGGGRAYAATSGTESAFSITRDSGATWNQASLIDTALSSILDLAPSPSYDRDNTLFILTWGGEHSLWRSLNGGARWERVYSSTLANVDSILQVELSPQYGSGSQVVFLAGTNNGKSAIWQSKDNGQHFTRRTARDPDTVTTFNIDTWAVADDSTLFAGSFDGSNGLIYHTTNSGWTYSAGAVVGSQSLNSIALSPDYEQDETILAGNTNGWVYWSSDNGISFEPLPPEAASPPLTGSITVIFDPEFSRNRTVYAASNTADKGVYRFIIDKSTKWESIDGSLPAGSMVSQPAAAADGTLYATNFQADGGMERSLNPTYSLGPKFETVTRGLDDDATLTGLWLGGGKLWSIDSHNTRLMTFSDTLTVPVVLTSPSSGAPGIGIKNIKLEWETLRGATAYQWQLDYDTNFSTIPAGFEGETKASSARLPALELDTTYYWRVRATKPALSPWSTKWSFTTSLGYEATSPQLQSPEAGARDMPLKPIFQWSAVAGADSYELVLSTAPSLANPTIVKSGEHALPGTAWQCDVNLSYDTAYYWKVRAVNADTFSDWSAVGAFITEPPPSPVSLSPSPSGESAPLPLPLPLPPSPSQQTAPDWSIYLMWLMGLIIILLLIITLMLAMRIRRP